MSWTIALSSSSALEAKRYLAAHLYKRIPAEMASRMPETMDPFADVMT